MLAYAFLLIFLFHYIVRRSFYCHTNTLPTPDHYCSHSLHQNACETRIMEIIQEGTPTFPCHYPPPPPPSPPPPRLYPKVSNRKKLLKKKKILEKKKEELKEKMDDTQAKAVKVSNANVTVQGVILTVVLTSQNMKQKNCPITTVASVIPTIVNLYSLWTHGLKYLKLSVELDELEVEIGDVSIQLGLEFDLEDPGKGEQKLWRKFVFALSVILLLGLSAATSSSCWLKTCQKTYSEDPPPVPFFG